MNIRTRIQALLICTICIMPLSAQGQSIVDSRDSLPRAVQLHGDEGRETVRPDESKRISPNEAPASRVQPQSGETKSTHTLILDFRPPEL